MLTCSETQMFFNRCLNFFFILFMKIKHNFLSAFANCTTKKSYLLLSSRRRVLEHLLPYL